MKKFFLSIVLLALAIFCGAQSQCWDGTVADAYDGGDGTPENPYQIANAAQLALLAEQTNSGTGGDACYILTGDICMNENVGYGNYSWIPVGYYNSNADAHYFEGIFDGCGHTISNLYCDNGEGFRSVGLFGMTNDAIIKNVNITNALIIATSSEKVIKQSGMIAGEVRNTDILNCIVDGTIQGSGRVGGIVGCCLVDIVNDTAFIANCVNNAEFDNNSKTGGIIGECSTGFDEGGVYQHGTIAIKNCVNNSNVSSIWSGGIVATAYGNIIIKNCDNYGKMESPYNIAGGIVGEIGVLGVQNTYLSNCLVEDCVNHRGADITGSAVGGIVGYASHGIINKCANHAVITGNIVGDTIYGGAFVGGISGAGGAVSNSFNRGDLTAIKIGTCDFDEVYIGGIIGMDEFANESHIFNVYNTGLITPPVGPSIQEYGYGNIVGYAYHPDDNYYNCYWLDDDEYPACGNEEMQEHPNLPGSTTFVQGATPTSWILNEAQYGTVDLLEALNAGSLGQCAWLEDVTGINDGYPVFDMAVQPVSQLVGNEWYYEITSISGEIYYQHLEYACDTTIDDKKVKVIVKTNSLYDLRYNEQPVLEYIYEENNRVYWWNNTLNEFTVLYDFAAKPGYEWVILVGDNSITMHVDDVWYYVKDARWYKALTVSDENDVFSGTILCGIGHLTSFFPEKLLDDKTDFEVDGLRCFWKDDVLLLKESNVECDYVYNDYHFGIDDNEAPAFTIYPNPATDAVTIDSDPAKMQFITSQIELMDIRGQRIDIRVKDNQIDVSNLQNGIYFIKIGNDIVKLIINR